MKVTLLSHLFPNKIDTLFGVFVAEKALALSRYAEVNIIAPVSYFPLFRADLPEVSDIFNGLPVSHPRFMALPSYLWHYRWLPYYFSLKEMSDQKYFESDIFLIEWIYPDAYAAHCLLEKYLIKTVAVIHGNEAIGYFENQNKRRKYAAALRKFNKIIAVSTDLKNKMMNEYGISGDKIVVIPNGIDPQKFIYMSKSDARISIGLPLDREIGVCVARISDEKNLDILVKAACKLQRESLDIYIIGDGPLRKEIELLITQTGMQNKIKLVGPLPHNEICKWLNAADFFCLPSQREGCPVVVHEALACGLPVLATAVGAIPDLISNPNYGLLCRESDVDSLISVLSKGLSIQWDRNKIASYGQRFTWDEVARKTLQVFEEILP